MSLVLWCKGSLYADSMFQTGEADGVEFSKVVMFKQPIVSQVYPEPENMKPLEQITKEELDSNPAAAAAFTHCLDVIYGGFFVGNLNVGKSIMAHIEKGVELVRKEKGGQGSSIFQYANLIRMINSAASLQLIGKFNTVTLVLVGKKRLYEIEVQPGGEMVNEKTRPHDDLFGFGTGGDYLSKNPYLVDRILDGSMHPSVAIQITMLQDKMSGGWVEWWTFLPPTDEKKRTSFERIGIYQPRTNEDMQELLAKPDGYVLPPDYMSTNEEHLARYISIRDEGKEVPAEVPPIDPGKPPRADRKPSANKKVKKHEHRVQPPRGTSGSRPRRK